ncbi:uncharacterized protein LTR77_006978 [Saxophila tyrrhenica]|uniref:Uncharacterized protein n=1 Tax=Saxophila tyrrhenica TaxID=1690608 RepID=A0AAV9P6V3_9PEZI|nr:hypothetical protein LTR77_006978 [Saxophila tyrrhenica]
MLAECFANSLSRSANTSQRTISLLMAINLRTWLPVTAVDKGGLHWSGSRTGESEASGSETDAMGAATATDIAAVDELLGEWTTLDIRPQTSRVRSYPRLKDPRKDRRYYV